MARAMRSFRSFSSGVFSIMGTTRVSSYLKAHIQTPDTHSAKDIHEELRLIYSVTKRTTMKPETRHSLTGRFFGAGRSWPFLACDCGWIWCIMVRGLLADLVQVLYVLPNYHFNHTLPRNTESLGEQIPLPVVWARVSSANPLNHFLMGNAKLFAREQQSRHHSSLWVCMNNCLGSWTE